MLKVLLVVVVVVMVVVVVVVVLGVIAKIDNTKYGCSLSTERSI
jgi:hypothetical protein